MVGLYFSTLGFDIGWVCTGYFTFSFGPCELYFYMFWFPFIGFRVVCEFELVFRVCFM